MTVERGEGRIESEGRPRVMAVWWAPKARSVRHVQRGRLGRDEQPAKDPSTDDVNEEIPDIPNDIPRPDLKKD